MQILTILEKKALWARHKVSSSMSDDGRLNVSSVVVIPEPQYYLKKRNKFGNKFQLQFLHIKFLFIFHDEIQKNMDKCLNVLNATDYWLLNASVEILLGLSTRRDVKSSTMLRNYIN